MKYNRDWLIGELEKGKSPKYLAFWGHRPSLDGSLTKTCFSQWWSGNAFIEDGIIYRTAEHYMMAGKAKLFGDGEIRSQIIESSSPGEAKKLGRKVKNFDQSLWESKRCEIVVRGNYLKFSQNESLKEFLLNTNNRIIVEASPVDKIWGIGMDPNNRNVGNPQNWLGDNLLGFCLMETRDILKLP
ncbi:MAG: NADAR family protein [Bacteroidota bacterium]